MGSSAPKIEGLSSLERAGRAGGPGSDRPALGYISNRGRGCDGSGVVPYAKMGSCRRHRTTSRAYRLCSTRAMPPYRGYFRFGTATNSMRARHLARSPAVSATHVRGEALVVTVHGTAEPLDLEGPDRDFRDFLRGHYGSDQFDQVPGGRAVLPDPARASVGRRHERSRFVSHCPTTVSLVDGRPIDCRQRICGSPAHRGHPAPSMKAPELVSDTVPGSPHRRNQTS